MGLRMRSGGVVITLLLVAFLLVSCGPRSGEALAEKIIEKAAARSGEDVDIQLDGEEVKVKDKDGNTFSMGSTDLPEGWPDSAPVSKKLEIVYSATSTSDGKQAWVVNATYDGPASDIYDYYKSELSGWEISADTVMDSSGAKSYILGAGDGTYEISVMLTGEDEATSVVIGLTEK